MARVPISKPMDENRRSKIGALAIFFESNAKMHGGRYRRNKYDPKFDAH